MTAADALGVLLSGAEQVVPEDGLAEKLALGRPLRVKFGVDPSRPDLHLGHAVPLRKLRQFQDLGHVAVLIIGDFTGRVGDPSGLSETRTMLTAEEIEANAKTYLDQAGRVLEMDGVEVRHNSEWLAQMGMDDVLRLTASTTVAQMLERDDFRTRFREGRAISVVEFLYPLLQGMDSVWVRADVELGGTDQTFNLLMGRELQRAWGQEPQLVLTVPLLEGIDGQRKMSKSYDNSVGLTDAPEEMFGRLMRVPDELIGKYLRLCTPLDPREVDRVEAGLTDGSLKPAEHKRLLAREVVDLYHGAAAGEQAEQEFDRVHKEHELPGEIPDRSVSTDVFARGPLYVPGLLAELGLVPSRTEGRRALAQAGVRATNRGLGLENERVTVDELPWKPEETIGSIWAVGRRRVARVSGFTDGS